MEQAFTQLDEERGGKHISKQRLGYYFLVNGRVCEGEEEVQGRKPTLTEKPSPMHMEINGWSFWCRAVKPQFDNYDKENQRWDQPFINGYTSALRMCTGGENKITVIVEVSDFQAPYKCVLAKGEFTIHVDESISVEQSLLSAARELPEHNWRDPDISFDDLLKQVDLVYDFPKGLVCCGTEQKTYLIERAYTEITGNFPTQIIQDERRVTIWFCFPSQDEDTTKAFTVTKILFLATPQGAVVSKGGTSFQAATGSWERLQKGNKVQTFQTSIVKVNEWLQAHGKPPHLGSDNDGTEKEL